MGFFCLDGKRKLESGRHLVGLEYSNLIEVTGPQPDVLRFRRDARRKVPPKLSKKFKIDEVDLSLEELFRKHRLEAPSESGIPWDFGIYFAHVGRTCGVEEFVRLDYSLVVKNYQICEFLVALSHVYPALCFVDSEACEGEEVMSTFVTGGRASSWTFPEKLRDGYLKRAAEANGIPDLEKAYGDGECDDSLLFAENEAVDAMMTVALRHWDKRVLSTLRKRRSKLRNIALPIPSTASPKTQGRSCQTPSMRRVVAGNDRFPKVAFLLPACCSQEMDSPSA
jgi:hypothetical protein